MTNSPKPYIVIMAAGMGKRMQSSLPKVLHKLADVPLLTHVLKTSLTITPDVFVVYGHGAAQVQAAYAEWPIRWVLQESQLGTGHAVSQVLPYLDDHRRVIILNGDVPLISAQTLNKLITDVEQTGSSLSLLTFNYPDPYGLGRIVRSADGQLCRIAEETDSTEAEKQINEAYTGILIASVGKLRHWLQQLDTHNHLEEYYLTDIVKISRKEGDSITTTSAQCLEEVLGVNNREQLAFLERCYQRQHAKRLLQAGVSFSDPDRFDLRGELHVGQDVCIDINVIIKGCVRIGSSTYIGPHSVLEDCDIGDGVKIEAYSNIQGAKIADHCVVGPFARIRPGSEFGPFAKVGSFVEIKKSIVGAHTKIPHLSYVGDASIGQNVNIGAGVVTCNYNGEAKFQTTIEDGAFVGSDVQFIAPVHVGHSATIAAGTTICVDVPAAALAVGRVRQTHIAEWAKRKKKKKQEKLGAVDSSASVET